MRETKSIQVHPDDLIVNFTIGQYERFGWECIGNQRCQEYDGQTGSADSGYTEHYKSFVKLTFSREKSSPWYAEIKQLETQYNLLVDEKEKINDKRPNPVKFNWIIAIIFYILYIVPGICYTIYYFSSKSSYEKKYAEWTKKDKKRLEQIEKEISVILGRAEELVNS